MRIALDFISKSKKKTKPKNRGIKTNINTVKEYLKQLRAFLNSNTHYNLGTNREVFEKLR